MTHTHETILQYIVHYLEESLEKEGQPAIQAQSHLLKDLNIDSVQSFEMVADLEDHYQITIPLDFFQRIATVDDVAREILTLLQHET